MAGQLDLSELEGPAWDGRPISQHLEAAGVEPERFATAARPKDSLAAYLELHIEQGGVLEQEGLQIGVVEGIVGIRRYELTFLGQANHAGTTPMRGRRDALVMAAPFVSGVRELALAEGIVGTVGTLAVHPGASNVIPGRVELTCETRSLDDGVLTRAEWRLFELASAQGGRMGPLSATAPVRSARRLVDALTSACGRLGLSYRVMPSGAGHDAMCMAAITDMAMLFVPSRGGVSHSPDEYTSPEDIVRGARVLLETLRDLDTRLT
jgi:N-carbamoyl-L-amino-acid hydrolase